VTYVRPILEYCSTVWNPHMKADIVRIENVQRKFSKRISNMRSLSYENRLNTLGLEKLEIRRLRKDLCFIYSILNGSSSLNSTDFFEVNRNQTRTNHPLKCFYPRCRLNLRKYDFCNRHLTVWNKLPQYVVFSGNIEIFKNRLHRIDLNQYLSGGT
jgi:hypothetical protein